MGVTSPDPPTAEDFSQFLAERQRSLLRFAMVLTTDSRIAEDVVADVLGRAFERWGHIATLADPNAYVRRMIVNEHLSLRRRWHRSAPHPDVSTLLQPAADTSVAFVERDAMLARLGKLPRKQRAVIVLRYYEGLSDRDIADVLQCTPGTVRSQMSRALAKLRLTVEQQSKPPTPPHHLTRLDL